MKKTILSVSIYILLIVGFFTFSIWPRDEGNMKAYMEQIYSEGMLIAENAMYAAELEYQNVSVTAIFRPQNYNGSLEERAASAIIDAAQNDNIELPDGFEDKITVKKLSYTVGVSYL